MVGVADATQDAYHFVRRRPCLVCLEWAGSVGCGNGDSRGCMRWHCSQPTAVAFVVVVGSLGWRRCDVSATTPFDSVEFAVVDI